VKRGQLVRMRTTQTLPRLISLLLMVTLSGAGAASALESRSSELPVDCAVSEAPHAVQTRAAQGDPVAQFQLAEGYLAALGCLMRRDAAGVNRTYHYARQWYQRAAVQGYGPAQVALGQLERTFGGDLREALIWFYKAAAQGCLDAYYALGQMYADGQGVAQDTAKAYRWYALAAGEARLALIKEPSPGAASQPCPARHPAEPGEVTSRDAFSAG
jgi:TPR repeat protein